MKNPKLFMLMLGCRPPGRNTEQHDMYFGIADEVKDLVPELKAFWPEAKDKLHVDAWREVTHVAGHTVTVKEKEATGEPENSPKLFFLNLGGYKPGEFDEFHYKMLVVAHTQGEASKQARQSTFYKHTGFTGAASHIDDKFGVDVDELFEVKDILTDTTKQKYTLEISQNATDNLPEDALHLGYFQLHKL